MRAVPEAIRAPLRLWLERAGVRAKRSFGLDDLDLALVEHIPFRNGFLLEAGANDGLRQSNMVYFERYRGWCGILVEPIPELAEKCRKNWPRTMVGECALVPFGYGTPTIDMVIAI